MTALTVPLALAVALHCAPTMDPAMLVGIARQESGLEPLTLRDDTSGEVLHGAGVVAAARRRIAAGHSVDLGLWQINSHNLSLLGLGVAEALEPCQAAAAAARLIELYSRYNTAVRQSAASRTATRRRSSPPSTASRRLVPRHPNPGCRHPAADLPARPVLQAGTDRTGSRFCNRKEIADVVADDCAIDLSFVTGTFGTTLVIIAVAIAGARAMLHGSWGHFWSAIGGGAVLVCASVGGADVSRRRLTWPGREILYLALTRPALTWGVPFEALALNVMVTFAAGLELSAPKCGAHRCCSGRRRCRSISGCGG